MKSYKLTDPSKNVENTGIFCRCVIKRKHHCSSRRIKEKYPLVFDMCLNSTRAAHPWNQDTFIKHSGCFSLILLKPWCLLYFCRIIFKKCQLRDWLLCSVFICCKNIIIMEILFMHNYYKLVLFLIYWPKSSSYNMLISLPQDTKLALLFTVLHVYFINNNWSLSDKVWPLQKYIFWQGIYAMLPWSQRFSWINICLVFPVC